MMGDLAPGASMPGLDPDIGEVAAIAQPKQKTLEESLDELLPVTSVDPFAVEQGSRPSIGDNQDNPFLDWLSGTDWSQGREAGKRPVLANVGPKLLNAAGFVNPQIAMLNRAIDMGKSFKKGPKEASLGILGSLIGNRFGARGQNIFNTARDIRSNKSTFKQGLGNLFMGELLGGMGKNRDVGQGILSMIGGKDPRQILGNLALGRATRRMDPTQGALFGAGVETMKGRPGMEAFGSAFKNIARRQGMQKLFQRAYQKGGRPAVQKLRAAMSFVPGGG